MRVKGRIGLQPFRMTCEIKENNSEQQATKTKSGNMRVKGGTIGRAKCIEEINCWRVNCYTYFFLKLLKVR